MRRYTSPPLDLPVLDPGEGVDRADLVFYGVDHSGPSYEARVFVDAPDADETTPTDVEHGYVGSFTVFAHDGCYGDEGHCLPDQRETDAFDHRAPHPLRPWTRTVTAEAPLIEAVRARDVTQVSVTVVAIAAVDEASVTQEEGLLTFQSIRLLTYQD